MLFRAEAWDGLRDGTITLAVRRWRRPTVTAGGTLITPGGQLGIDAVEAVEEGDLSEHDARAAGAASLEALLADLPPPSADRRLYRVRFHRLGDDPRTALREDAELSGDEVAELAERLGRSDRRSADGPWTREVLALLADAPGEPSRLLCERVGTDQATFKRRVRVLKGLGLTESLGTGYRLSPRGERFRTLDPGPPDRGG